MTYNRILAWAHTVMVCAILWAVWSMAVVITE